MLLVTEHEADDAIGTLALRAADQGIDAAIVTADRDFFQLVATARGTSRSCSTAGGSRTST